MTPLEIIVLTLSGVGVLVGIAGTVLPLLPGLPLVFFSVLLYGAVTRFTQITADTILILGLLTIAALFIDAIAIMRGVRRMGGTPRGMVGAMIGAFLGLFFGNFLGMIAGLLLGVIVGELRSGMDAQRMLKAAAGAALGVLVSSVLRFVIALAMVAIAVMDLLHS